MMKLYKNYLLSFFFCCFFLLSPLVIWAYEFRDAQFFGLGKTVHEIRSSHLPKDYVFVGVGRSPSPMIAYHQHYGDDAFNLPMTWSSSKYEEKMKEIRKKLNVSNDEDFSMDLAQMDGLDFFSARDKMKLKDHFNRFLGPAIEQALKTGKKLLLMDLVSTGIGLFLTNLYMNDYLKKTGLTGKLQVEYLGIGLGGNSGLQYQSPSWHTYEVGKSETLDFHGSLVLKSFKDYAEYDTFVVDDDIHDSASLRPNPKYKIMQAALQQRHPKFLQQISYANKRENINQLVQFEKMIDDMLKDGTCSPGKTLAVFDIDSVLTVDELDESYPRTMELDTAEVLKRIQKSGISTMALTNRKAINVKSRVNPFLFLNTYVDLIGLNMKFGKSSQIIEEGLEKKKKLLHHQQVKGGVFFPNQNSAYYQGVYSLDHDMRGKGDRLQDLLENAGLENQFECLFFVDDSEWNNKDVEEQFRYKMHVFSANLKAPTIQIAEMLDEFDDFFSSTDVSAGTSSCRIELIDE